MCLSPLCPSQQTNITCDGHNGDSTTSDSCLKLSFMDCQSQQELSLCAFILQSGTHRQLLSDVHKLSSTTIDMKPNNFVTRAQHFPSQIAHAVTSGCYLLAIVLSFAVLLFHTIFCFQLSWAKLY